MELRGHRVTGSRRRVLEAVLAQPQHFSVDDVLHAAPRVGRATVFRTMKLLLDLNIVCRVLLEDFSRCDVQALTRELAAATGYEIERHWLEVYGRCATCRLPAEKGGEGAR